MTVQDRLNLAVTRHRAGAAAEAEALCRQILHEFPTEPEALNLLGVLCHQARQLTEAQVLLERAVAADPLSHQACFNLGNLLRDMGRPREAVAAFRRSLGLRPDNPAALANLGRVLRTLGQADEAAELYRQALRMDPHCFEALYNLANILMSRRSVDEAVEILQRAVQVRPDHALAMAHLGRMFAARGELDAAIEAYDKALKSSPQSAAIASERLCSLLFCPGQTTPSLRAELDAFDRQFRQNTLSPAVDRDPDRRLRIGYISGDFCQHVIAWNVLPLLSRHDHAAFEVFAYSNLETADAMTERLRGCVDHWRGIFGVSDDRVADMIRQDRIDILVDLAVHILGNRLPVLARKPAPVQITFAGYPGSTGLSAVHWRLTDPRLDPPGLTDADYIEKSYRLPGGFWCYEPDLVENYPEVGPLPALANGYVTLGCLNTFGKINDPVLDLWGRIMQRIAGSHLRLLAPPGRARQHVLEMLGRHGVQPDRVEFVAFQPRPLYLAEFSRIDLCLDTLPYQGHTTSLDGLWMGVPVVSCLGKTVVGRAAASQLYNLQLTELLADDDRHYMDIAASLAADLPRLAELRRTLRKRMRDSALTDGRQFAGQIETAYREIWKHRCNEMTTQDVLTTAGEHHKAGRLADAMALYRQVIEAEPANVPAIAGLGDILYQQGKMPETIALFERLTQIQPSMVAAHFMLGVARLTAGDLENAWPEFEWRWETPPMQKRLAALKKPLWDGSPLNGRDILLHGERGAGDTLHFLRYVPMVAARGGSVILTVQPEVLGLVKRLEGVHRLVNPGEHLPEFDVHCSLVSLPAVFETTLDTIPNAMPYLHADLVAAERWREKIEAASPTANLKVGLVWAGQPVPPGRSVSLEALAALAKIPGVSFISLQKGEQATQIAASPLPLLDWTADLKDFADTAALIENLDLVISVDTSVTQLAGAMGKQVWTLLKFVPDWRWMLQRADSPWYPSMRLFRQPTIGDWATPIREVVEELSRITSGSAD